jgi:hypothetical protein
MPIHFRCTGCRSKLYVPARWHGTSIVCPRCETRVMVPAEAAGGVVTSFEGAAIEASLEALAPTANEPFDAAPFTVKVSGKVSGKSRRKGKRPARPPAVVRQRMVTFPAWAPYAWGVGSLFLAVGAFFAGIWWASRGGGS